MFILEATRRARRADVARIRDAIREYDRIVFKDVDLEDTYEIVQLAPRRFVLAINDPTLNEERANA